MLINCSVHAGLVSAGTCQGVRVPLASVRVYVCACVRARVHKPTRQIELLTVEPSCPVSGEKKSKTKEDKNLWFVFAFLHRVMFMFIEERRNKLKTTFLKRGYKSCSQQLVYSMLAGACEVQRHKVTEEMLS